MCNFEKQSIKVVTFQKYVELLQNSSKSKKFKNDNEDLKLFNQDELKKLFQIIVESSMFCIKKLNWNVIAQNIVRKIT
jgi:hypothetical protein